MCGITAIVQRRRDVVNSPPSIPPPRAILQMDSGDVGFEKKTMFKHPCPRCGAELPDPTTARDDLAVCPVCREPMSILGPQSPPQPSGNTFPLLWKPLPDVRPSERIAAWACEDRLLVEIGSGSNSATRCLAFCGIGGLVFMALLLWEVLNAPGGLIHEDLIVPGVAFVLLLPVFGAWVYARFGKTRVRIEETWLEIENRLFGIPSRREYPLGLESRATLVGTHRLFNEVLYGIRIGAVGEQPVFGRWLFRPEQEWIVRQINRHLGHGDWDEVRFNENTEVEFSLMEGFSFGDD